MTPHRALRIAGTAGVLLWAMPASAQLPSNTSPGLWERGNLLGDLEGLRPFLGNYGVTLGVAEIGEVFGNPTGGVRRGVAYDGLTELSLGIDTSKVLGWSGGLFNVSALQIHGRDLSSDDLDTLQTASGIEADRATRLWESWFQQAFLGGKLDVKLGQQSVDQEFIISQGSSLFINTAMGWPIIPTIGLYAGGPAYPLSSLGIRLRAQPTDSVTVLGGVFDDNPPGGSFETDSQVAGAAQSGTRFNTGTGALIIAEIQYAVNAPSGPPQTGAPSPAQPATAPPPPGLPGTYKLGFYYDTGAFPSQRFARDGLPFVDPASDGVAAMVRGNEAIYGVMDQTVWRPNPKGARALSVFARIMGAPGAQNLVEFSINAGLTLQSPIEGRDNDTVGLGYGLAHVSSTAAAADKDIATYTGSTIPVRSSESFIELTYQARLVPWWIVQPDLQYVFTPGGGIVDPLAPGQRIGNELVLGIRTDVTF